MIMIHSYWNASASWMCFTLIQWKDDAQWNICVIWPQCVLFQMFDFFKFFFGCVVYYLKRFSDTVTSVVTWPIVTMVAKLGSTGLMSQWW